MTDADDRELERVDRAARAASRGLHAHVDRRVDPDIVLAALPASAPTHRRGRLLAAAAVAALLIGSVAALSNDGDGDDRSRLEVDEDGNALPTPEPGSLTPLGPNDGRDSIRLPITVEPDTDLEEGDVVTATGPGFVPGERVGIVQCVREPDDEPRERRAGVDGCNISTVKYADADGAGVATGTITVQRILTTPASGTVDCGSEPERCIVAMGALTDYDRSGGRPVSFTGGGEPVAVPTIAVEPAEELADGDIVHVRGEGFRSGSLVSLEVCSLDSQTCWQTGEATELDAADVEDPEPADGGVMPGQGSYLHVGLVADGDGRIEGDVPVWRYLPASASGSYADCAVSECTLRVRPDSGYSPVPAVLSFTPGGARPEPPAVAVDPADDLAPGDEVVVRGAGFEPGSYYSISLCATPVGQPENILTCLSTDSGQERVDPDGGFARRFEIPEVQGTGEMTATTVCSRDGGCDDGAPVEIRCDGVETDCTIRVDAYRSGEDVVSPQFPPEPVPITLRR